MATPELDLWTARHLLIPQRLRLRRCELGLTQKQVVTRLGRCGVHTTNRALSSMEHGAGIDVAKLPELAVALNCTVTYLIGLTDDPHRWEPDVQFPRTITNAPVTPSRPRPMELARNSPSRNGLARNGQEVSLILGDDIPDRGQRYNLT